MPIWKLYAAQTSLIYSLNIIQAVNIVWKLKESLELKYEGSKPMIIIIILTESFDLE